MKMGCCSPTGWGARGRRGGEHLTLDVPAHEVERAPGHIAGHETSPPAPCRKANLALHTKGIAVSELRRMATTPHRERDCRRHARVLSRSFIE
jgi:hypothetical protein